MAIRERILGEQLWCQRCQAPGRSDDVVDHRIPLAEGGTDEDSNRQRLCRTCHRAKSIEEAQRGRRRAASLR